MPYATPAPTTEPTTERRGPDCGPPETTHRAFGPTSGVQ